MNEEIRKQFERDIKIGERIKKQMNSEYDPTLFFSKGEASEPKFNANFLAETIKEDIPILTLADTEEMFWFDKNEGIWKPGGEAKVRAKAREILGDYATNHYINETLEAVKQTSYIDRSVFDSLSLDEIPVANGILNWKTKELRPYRPEDYVTQKIPVKYNPNAKAEAFNKFLNEVVVKEDVQLLKEIFAYCLYRDYPIQKAVMLVGDGENGKSTYLGLLSKFLGDENISTVSLQDLETNRFAAALLYKKLANIHADLTATALKSPGRFKILTGGDYLMAEKKFKNPFQFKNYAKLIFSANQVPYVDDQSDAFYRRWIIISFPFKFVNNPTGPNERKKDEYILNKLTTEEELSGILNECLEILPKLLENGFSYKKTTEEIREAYLKAASPVAAFVTECVIEDPDSYVAKEDLYNAYCEYCRTNKLPIKSQNSFHKELKKYVKVNEEQKKFGPVRKRVYVGIKLTQVTQDAQVLTYLKGNENHDNENLNNENHDNENRGNLNMSQPVYPVQPVQTLNMVSPEKNKVVLSEEDRILSIIPVGIEYPFAEWEKNCYAVFNDKNDAYSTFWRVVDKAEKEGRIHFPKPNMVIRRW